MVVMRLLPHRLGGALFLLSHSYVGLPTASARAPFNKNNASTSLVQARLGQALFFLLVLQTRSVGKQFAQTR